MNTTAPQRAQTKNPIKWVELYANELCCIFPFRKNQRKQNYRKIFQESIQCYDSNKAHTINL